MNKKYKLLKDIQQPNDRNYKAGELFTKSGSSLQSAYVSSDGNRSFHPALVENNPEWFEEIKSKFNVYVHELVMANSRKVYGYSFNVLNVGIDCGKIKAAIEEILNPPKDLTKEQIGELIKEMHNQPIQFLKRDSLFKKKESEILLWKNFNGIVSTKKFVAPCKIHAVLRLTDNTEWVVGDETQLGIINKIEEVDDNPLVFYVGERNYPLFIYEAKKNKK